MNSNVRWRAAQALHQVLAEQRSLNQILGNSQTGLSRRDSALLQELCFGCCRNLHQMQFWVKECVKKPLKTRDHDVLALIYLGIYQLLFTRIPDHAAIGETVAAAKYLQKPWAKALLNGVLRNVQRQRENSPSAWQEDDVYQYSHPKWFIQQLKDAWPDHWPAILQANNQKPPMTLRVNVQKGSVENYLTKLQQTDISAVKTQWCNTAITLNTPCDVEKLPDFDQGMVSVQDEAAQLAAQLLDLKEGQRVLDACCAPGGKTCHILETESHLAQVVALDNDAQRLQKVAQNLQRLQLTAILKEGDAGNPSHWWDGQLFDRILVDAPCSATGVIRRHPDIKLLRRAEQVTELAQLQQLILQALWPTLRPGGKLVYATCSVLPAENEQVMGQFLASNEDAIEDKIDANWGIARPCGRQLFPTPGSHDGFYYARLIKAE